MKTRHYSGLLPSVLAALMLIVSSAGAQTYKADFATKLILAGGGTDITNSYTLIANTLTGSHTWILPDSNGAAGSMLITDGAGHLGWVNTSSAITLAGDVTGAAGSNTVAKINGVNLGPTTATAANLLVASGTRWVSRSMSGDASIDSMGHVIVSSYNNGTTFGSMAAQNSNNVTITGGTINNTTIGLTNPAAAQFTDLTVTGNVTLPPGAVTASSLGLDSAKILIGGTDNYAAPRFMSQDVTLRYDGAAFVHSVQTDAGASIATAINSNAGNLVNGGNVRHDTTLKVTANELGINFANNNTWTGSQTFGKVALTAAADLALLAGTNNDIAISATSSMIRLTAAGAASVTSIANPSPGRVVVLVNADATDAITLLNETAGGTTDNQLHIPGGSAIVAPYGTVTLIYDGTLARWRMIDY